MRGQNSDILNKKVLLLDGATGSVLYDKGGDHPELLSLSNAESVANLHRSYLEAGADVIRTNTFNACALPLEEVENVCEAAVKIARECVDKSGYKALVAGVISPFGDRNKYEKQIDALLRGGVDLLLFETVMSCDAMVAAFEAAREQEKIAGIELPKIYSATITGGEAKLISGESLEQFALQAEALQPFAVGLNCGGAPEDLSNHLQELSKYVTSRLIFYPSAGLPGEEAGIERFIDIIKESMKIGASIVGGCCGTTPEYISALSRII